jgi:bifunctional enzyme CysN/CysC
MLCRPHNRPLVTQDVEAMVCWMDDRATMQVGGMYSLQHTTRRVRAMVTDLRYELDISALHRNHEATTLGLNAIGRVTLRSTAPLFIDPYQRNRATGSFILVDESSNATVAAGMIIGGGA